ncbi:MAG: hypothetical protein AMXMBFR44_3990 [Candidatus Campbellbacteria bacterium]
MVTIDPNKIKTRQELLRVAKKDLEGKTLLQIAKWIGDSDVIQRVNSKAAVGYVIEEGYFGVRKNSTAKPDLEKLGVEIKTSPLKQGKDGKLRVKEPLSLNIINYTEESKNRTLKESSLYKKNHRVLFVWYIHDSSKKRSEYKIKYVFLWEMSSRVLLELAPDYEKILRKIKAGRAHEIHQSDHERLTLCPKHGGTFRDPNDKKSKVKQPFSNKPAEIRAFRLKNSYMNQVIYRYLSKERPGEVHNFVSPKKNN